MVKCPVRLGWGVQVQLGIGPFKKFLSVVFCLFYTSPVGVVVGGGQNAIS